MNILMVCLGNICRSPMAEGIFRESANKSWVVDSAGTSGYHDGDLAHPGTRKILQELSISSETLISRRITRDDFTHFDIIFAMDSSNYNDLIKLAPTSCHPKIKMFHPSKDIPDPWYTGNFEETRNLIIDATKHWLERL